MLSSLEKTGSLRMRSAAYMTMTTQSPSMTGQLWSLQERNMAAQAMICRCCMGLLAAYFAAEGHGGASDDLWARARLGVQVSVLAGAGHARGDGTAG